MGRDCWCHKMCGALTGTKSELLLESVIIRQRVVDVR
jgi:hypothetical protein